MGRPYATEIAELNDTFRWGLSAAIEGLTESVLKSADHGLLAIGSGGSLTSAHFAVLLHSLFTGQNSQVQTPYELLGSSQSLRDTSILVCSAGGSNPDVLACVERAANRYPQHLFAITTRVHSQLERLLQHRAWPICHAYSTPTRKDGFLATNSLLATIVLLVRAYEKAFSVPHALPQTLDELIHPGMSRADYMQQLVQKFSPLCLRDSFIVLHGSSTKPAAADFESRFTEAALANVQIADFRNFAHGRHHWLAVHANKTGVLAFSSPEDRDVANRTLSLIPKQVPRLNVMVNGGVSGAVAAVCHSLLLAQVAGPLKNIDPGRPHVPVFGRKLYHLKAKPEVLPTITKLSNRAATAIERKSGFVIASLEARQELNYWTSQYSEFIQKLRMARIKAIVLDYDGTLCGPERRIEGPSDEVIKKLTALLKTGVTIAIATGRGKSVRETLHKRFRSAPLRKQIIIGYHNGSEISTLDDPRCPPEASLLHKSLVKMEELIRKSSLITDHAQVQAKGSQITIELHGCDNRTAIFDQVARISRNVPEPGVSIVTSTHSIDVLAPKVSKLSLLGYLKSTGIKSIESSVLCVGDRGKWPGNDADLLSHPLSLSVDQVSSDPTTCWNLSGCAQRFDSACLEYLEMITIGHGHLRFNVNRLKL